MPYSPVETRPMFDEPFRFAEPRQDGLPATGVMDEAELRGQRLLLLTEGHCLRDQALAICATSDTELDGDFRATSLERIVQMVATGLGNTLLPAMACVSESARGVTTRQPKLACHPILRSTQTLESHRNRAALELIEFGA